MSNDHENHRGAVPIERRIRILLADEHLLVVQALRVLLEAEPRFEVAATAGDGLEAVRTTAALSPDVVLMEVRMPEMNGIEAARRILSREVPPRVLFLSASGERRFVGAALKLGASGYLLKTSGREELTTALLAVARGETYLSPAIGQTVVECLREAARADSPLDGPLSPREREVLQLVAEGRSTKEIAERLNVTPRTVGTHREHIMEKLGIRSVAALTKYAVREGLTSVE